MNQLWSEDFEVLHWVVERFERTGHSIEVGEALRVFPEDEYDRVRESLHRLSDHSYVVTVNGNGLRHGARTASDKVTEHALRLVDALPDNPQLIADRMLAVLAEAAVTEPDPDRRFKIQAGLKGVGEMTRDVLVEVLATAIDRSTSAARTLTPMYAAAPQDHY